jgi:hypothetical protein
MSTENQIEANRQNAQLCTGPKTEEGKARSSQNALKTGIYSKSELLITESREALDELIADFHTRFAPATPEERSLVDALIRYEWLTRRYMAADTAVWNRALLQDDDRDPGRAFMHHSETLARAGRYFHTARKGFSTTLKELQALQEKRKSEQQPKSNQSKEAKLVSFRRPQISPIQEAPQPIWTEEKQPPMEPGADDQPGCRPGLLDAA